MQRYGDRWYFTYVHDDNPRSVEFLYDPFGGNTNGGHEKGGLLLYVQNEVNCVVSWLWHAGNTLRTRWTHLNDNVNQLRKLSLLVVVLNPHETQSSQPHVDPSGLVCPRGVDIIHTLVFLAFPPT